MNRTAALGLVLSLLAAPLVARPGIVVGDIVATLPSGTAYLLDRATLRTTGSGASEVREAIVRTDNRRTARGMPAPTDQVSSENLFRFRCATGQYQIQWTRIFQRDGRQRMVELPGGAPLRDWTTPATGGFEAGIVSAACRP